REGCPAGDAEARPDAARLFIRAAFAEPGPRRGRVPSLRSALHVARHPAGRWTLNYGRASMALMARGAVWTAELLLSRKASRSAARLARVPMARRIVQASQRMIGSAWLRHRATAVSATGPIACNA